MDILITLALVFMVWMCIDCMQRKEHFVWIIIMVVLFPALVEEYYSDQVLFKKRFKKNCIQ